MRLNGGVRRVSWGWHAECKSREASDNGRRKEDKMKSLDEIRDELKQVRTLAHSTYGPNRAEWPKKIQELETRLLQDGLARLGILS